MGGAIKSLTTGLVEGLTSIIPVVGPIISQFAGAITAGFSKLFVGIFGGPDAAELAGRGISDEFKAWAAEAATAAYEIEIARLVSEGWARDLATQVVVVVDSYATLGLSAEEASRDVQATWDAIKQGPEAVTAEP